MSIPFYSDADVERVLSYGSVCVSLDQAFLDLSRGRAAVHARHRTDCQEVKLSTMGAIWSERKLACVKSYTTIAGQFSFLVTLFDTQSNRPLAVLEANALTRFRTAALTRLVAEKAVKPGCRKLALFGAGQQGQAQAEALCEALKLSDICVVDPNIDIAWCVQFEQRFNCRVQISTSTEAIVDADLVVTATRSKTPVFDGTGLKVGALVIAMGTSLPNGRELDDTTLARTAQVIVESKPQSMEEAGEVVMGLASGALNLERIVDLASIYQKQAVWRAAADDIIVFKSVGIGLADLACAALMVNAA